MLCFRTMVDCRNRPATIFASVQCGKCAVGKCVKVKQATQLVLQYALPLPTRADGEIVMRRTRSRLSSY